MRLVYIALGWAALALGAAGMLLPLLPTVPFLLLAAICFARGSERCHDWLVGHPRLGPPIQAWREEGAISPGSKRAAMVAIALSFGISLALGAAPVVLAVQAVVLGAVSVFILTRPAGRAR